MQRVFTPKKEEIRAVPRSKQHCTTAKPATRLPRESPFIVLKWLNGVHGVLVKVTLDTLREAQEYISSHSRNRRYITKSVYFGYVYVDVLTGS